MPALLTASHIVPWSLDPSNRLNPKNGLCLSALHDRAFDAGIISISPTMTVLVSQKSASKANRFFESAILAYQGASIFLPQKFHPDPAFLKRHRETVFRG
jgi:predicted restriction endonuclease